MTAAVKTERAAAEPADGELAPPGTIVPTRLVVVNGDLSFSKRPVIVGHYIGDSVAGSEAQLDAALGGALYRRYKLGAYPGPVDTAIVARAVDGSGKTGVVVGLGDMASFSVTAVRIAVVRGLLELALAGESFGASLVMLGARAGLIPTADLLAAMLTGIAEAERRMEAEGLPRIFQIQIMAQMEDSAHLIWHHLSRLTQQPRFKDDFLLIPEVKFSTGATRRVSRLASTDDWQAIQIDGCTLADGSAGLRFNALGGQARAEGYLSPANTAMVRSLFKQIDVRNRRYDWSSPARGLFQLVWPSELKRISYDDRNVRLILDSAAAQLPFELMDDRKVPTAAGDLPPVNPYGDGADATPARPATVLPKADATKPPAVRHGLLRQLVQDNFARIQPASSPRATALVIGDPRGGPTTDQFKPLPDAIAEATAVADLLEQNGFAVTRLIGDAVLPVQVVETLLRGGWTIVHIAAHGIYDATFWADEDAVKAGTLDKAPLHTGVVLGDRITLSPSMLHGLADPPALAFMNCCNLASVDDADEQQLRAAGRPEFAASFAAELIALGTSTVIAAGWTVQDPEAKIFSLTLYEQLLKSELGLGEAVRVAREAAYDINPEGSTWGAYQCYGEPDWQLRAASMARLCGPSKIELASHAEALTVLGNIASEAKIGAGRDGRRRDFAEELATIDAKVRAMAWLEKPLVAEALGFAHAALGDFDKAIGCFETALAADAQPSLALVETLANLQIRKAANDAAAGTLPASEARAIIAKARDRLTALCVAAGETPERLSIIGGGAKREAEIATGEDCDKALVILRDTCRRSWDLANSTFPIGAYYPAQLTCTASVLLALRGSGPGLDRLAADLAAFNAACSTDADPDDRWRAASRVEARLLDRLAASDFSDTGRDAQVAAYLALWRAGGDGMELDSMLGQLRFIRDILDEKGLAAAVDWLRAIEAGVTKALAVPA